MLAVANSERGADTVIAERLGAVISAVNHAEVVSKLLRSNLLADDIDQFLFETFPRVIPFDRQQAGLSAKLHAKTRKQKLSYADCACLALAAAYEIPVLTGDLKWSDIPGEIAGVEVRQFR